MKRDMPYESYKQNKCRTCKINKKCVKDREAIMLCAITKCYTPMYEKSEYEKLIPQFEKIYKNYDGKYGDLVEKYIEILKELEIYKQFVEGIRRINTNKF